MLLKKMPVNTIPGAVNKRWYFTYNFYTRHTLAKHLLSYSDNEVHLIGTCKLNVMDATNLENVREALREISGKNVERN